MQVIGTTFPNQDGLTVHRKEGVGIGDGGDYDVEQPNEENQLRSHPADKLKYQWKVMIGFIISHLR